MSYVDGFIVPVPTNKVAAYREVAAEMAALFRTHGALEYSEFIADDVKPGQVTSFPQSVILQDDEIVVFSFIRFESREHRDRVNAQVMAEPRVKEMMDPSAMPFDGKRMVFGGFASLLET